MTSKQVKPGMARQDFESQITNDKLENLALTTAN